MRNNPTYTALLGPTRLLISEKFVTYTINWSYTIIWQVRVGIYNAVYLAIDFRKGGLISECSNVIIGEDFYSTIFYL